MTCAFPAQICGPAGLPRRFQAFATQVGPPAVELWTMQFAGSGTEDRAYFEVQMPHAWAAGTADPAAKMIYPHIHVVPMGRPAAVQTMLWEFDYSVTNPEAVGAAGYPVATTSSLYCNVAVDPDDFTPAAPALITHRPHYMANFGTTPVAHGIDTTGWDISAIMICRIIRRTAAPLPAGFVADDYTQFASLLSFDIHYALNAWGSRDITIK
jgi:hypothetical protein